jgi:hypothetical protein
MAVPASRVARGTACLVVSLAAAAALAAGALSPADSDRLQRKIDVIREHDLTGQSGPRRTPVSESELNSYLTYGLAGTLPDGVTEPFVQIEATGRLSARAVVDLTVVNAGRSSGRFDPLSLLSGKLPVAVVGMLTARAGEARITLESTTISGAPVPEFLLQALVSYYTRSPEHPDGISIGEPFALPSGIREIQFGRGAAVIVQ